MKPKLDPRARAAVDYLTAVSKDFCGPIIPCWLSRALPPTGPKRTWRDYVAIYILADIFSAHRVYKDGEPFFSGPLYRVDREKWAREIPTTLKQVSLTLSWLAEDVKVIGRLRRPVTKDGQPCGSETLVWPIMNRLCELIEHFQEHGGAVICPMPKKRGPEEASDDGFPRSCQPGNLEPLQDATSTSSKEQLGPHSQSNFSLNSRATRNTAEGGEDGDREQRANDDSDRKAEPAPSAPVTSNEHAKSNAGPSTVAAELRWSPPDPPACIKVTTEEEKQAWYKTMRFAALWKEAIVRSGTVTSSAFTLDDKKAAFSYFLAHPEVSGFFPLAVAVQAWQLARDRAKPKQHRRRLIHIPCSLDPIKFFGSISSGKLEAEVGMFVKVNAWTTLRWWFTESELVFYGWPKVPIVAIDIDELWEHDPGALGYYQDRRRDLPKEVKAVVERPVQEPSLPPAEAAKAPNAEPEEAHKVNPATDFTRPAASVGRKFSPIADEDDS